MNDTAQKMREISEKLDKDADDLMFIKDSLEKSSQLTHNMVTILTSFENRLRQLEETILPVHKETVTLQKLQENIENTQAALDHVLNYHDAVRDLDAVIRDGPSGGKLEQYVSHMGQIQDALEFFSENNPSSPELSKATQLFKTGKELLQNEFRNLLTRHCNPVPAIKILDMLGTDDELPDSASVTSLNQLPEQALEELSEISKWLIGPGKTHDFMDVYYQIRAQTLKKSMEGLKDHLSKKSSGSAAGSYSPLIVSTNTTLLTPTSSISHPSPILNKTLMKGIGGLKDHLNRSTGSHSPLTSGRLHKSKDAPNKRTSTLLRPMARKGAANKLDPERRPSSQGVESQGHVDPAIESYLYCISGLLKLMQCEAQLMSHIIPEEHQRKTFDKIIEKPLEMVSQDGEAIATTAKRAVIKHDYTAILSIFPVLKHLINVKPEFEETLSGTAPGTRGKLPTLIASLETTGAKALDEFYDVVKNDPEKSNLPKDGTVHELTSNTLIFLENLLDYVETTSAMLMAQKDPAFAISNKGNDMENKKKRVANYVAKILGAVGLNLDQKSKSYSDQYLGVIFLLNNLNYILKSLQRSGLLSLVVHSKPDIERDYEEKIRIQKTEYSRSWSRVLQHVIDGSKPMAVNLDPSKMKDKERQQIKDRFKGFNQDFEDLFKTHKGYAVPDPQVREDLRRESKQMIVQQYTMFRDRYVVTSFTKNPEKYIKYTPEQVSSQIDHFFDISA
ncbi:exocyst complex component 7-like isoform X1 [Amphiura filiformis]|uniref:exocyst complex component 7-like isoform X1 n=1 Tax=Amphiura filiformis TaxID=82378 RepID=UPI003B20CB42